MERFFGTPDGVEVGQLFPSRQALRDAGVHLPLQAGISGTRADGADSIVVSGGYDADDDHGEYVIYTGHGGHDPNTRRQIGDQSADAPGNAGLITSFVRGLPVRVTRGAHAGSPYAPQTGYMYAGLFNVTSHWSKIWGQFLIQQFRLDREPEQPELPWGEEPDQDPAFVTTTVSRRVRDSAMARKIKALYKDTCQLCGIRIIGRDGRAYSEGAHVRPLGRPHLGADTAANLLCLCPNHHTQLDIGGIVINDDMTVNSIDGQSLGEITFLKSHRVDTENVAYQRGLWDRK